MKPPKRYKKLIEDFEDAYIAFSSEDGRLNMTVFGDPENINTTTAHQCVEVFSLWLEYVGVKKEDNSLEFMKTKGTA